MVDYWRLGDGVGRLRLVCGGLERELAIGWIFWQKMRQVFVVEDSGCGES